mgnify:CR=1 FL=1
MKKVPHYLHFLCSTVWDTKTTLWDTYFTVWNIKTAVWYREFIKVKKSMQQGVFSFIHRRKQIIFSGFFSPLPAHLPPENHREYHESLHYLPQ